MKNPRLSVILPVFNGESYLQAAIESVLAQHYPDTEILVIDDGSEDRSADIARGYSQVRYFQQNNQGPAAARNLGIRLAESPLLSFIDADDLWPTQRLSRLLPYFEKQPSLDMVQGTMSLIGPDLKSPQPETPAFLAFTFGCCIVRAELFEKVGPLDIRMRQAEDTDWMTRARESGAKILTVEELALYYRRHPGNLSHDPRENRAFLLKAAKNALDRKKESNPSA